MAKKIMEEGQPFFDVWMYQVSDEIQSLALAFGERYVLQNALSDLAKVEHAGAKEALRKAIFLHCVTLVRNNVAWYLINEVISISSGTYDFTNMNEARDLNLRQQTACPP